MLEIRENADGTGSVIIDGKDALSFARACRQRGINPRVAMHQIIALASVDSNGHDFIFRPKDRTQPDTIAINELKIFGER